MTDGLFLLGVQSKRIIHVWDKVKELIKNALEYADGKYTLFDIQYALMNKTMQLWIVVDKKHVIHGIWVTQIAEYPSKKVMLFVLISGVKFDNWVNFVDDLKRFAKEHHCDAIEGYGRTGWEKKATQLGFKKIYTLYSLDITGDD